MANTDTPTVIATRRRPAIQVRDSAGKRCRVRSRYCTTDELVDVHAGYAFLVEPRTGAMYAIAEGDL